ncbi:envelope stress response membrane protein PspC [uncultured Desulfobacter sp.]|uniref:envelope stress response membrane protein PspC n=1 Tax=uncultured Desulfobacter sp. TaxID=240139 RepID=UPI0029F4F423|nr:envelope stress response membrane protein PspC [uncultured Desulfobacter sp.]
MRYHKNHYRRAGAGMRGRQGRYGGFRQRMDRLTAAEGFYRSRRGIFLGVCRGLAEHLNVSVFWTRIIVFVLFLFTGFWPVGVLYFVAGLLLKIEPVIPLENENDKEFYQSYTHSRSSAIQRIKNKFDNIDRRIQRMEDTVTSKEFDFK